MIHGVNEVGECDWRLASLALPGISLKVFQVVRRLSRECIVMDHVLENASSNSSAKNRGNVWYAILGYYLKL